MPSRCRRRTLRTEPSNIAEAGQNLRRVQVCDATKISQRGSAGARLLCDLGVGRGDVSIQVTDLGDEVDGESTQGLSGGVVGPYRAQQKGRFGRVELPRRPAGQQPGSSTCNLFTVWVRFLTDRAQRTSPVVLIEIPHPEALVSVVVVGCRR